MKIIWFILIITIFTVHSFGQPGGGGGFIISNIINSNNKLLHFNSNCDSDTCLKIIVYKINLVDSGILFTNSNEDLLTFRCLNKVLRLENETGIHDNQRVILILKSDTMIFDIFGIPPPNGAGFVGGFDSLVFEKGYFIFSPKRIISESNRKRIIKMNLNFYNNNILNVPSLFYKEDGGVLINKLTNSKNENINFLNNDSLKCRVFVTGDIKGVFIKEWVAAPTYLDYREVKIIGSFVDQELCINNFTSNNDSIKYMEFSYNYPDFTFEYSNSLTANLLIIYNKDTMLLDFGRFLESGEIMIIDSLNVDSNFSCFNEHQYYTYNKLTKDNINKKESYHYNEVFRALNSNGKFNFQQPHYSNLSNKTILTNILINY